MSEMVADQYAEKSVLITGCTGFIGKVLLEKLVYSCPNIENIYCLLRGKNNLSAEQRLQSLLESSVFDRIRDKPNCLKKIKAISGDISQSNLGLQREDEQLLLDTVSIVFHSAATVKFNETLEAALETNCNGTKRILNLCQRLKKLKVLVHLSTAFAHTHRTLIEEVFYPPPVPIDMIDELIQYPLDPQQTKEILGVLPNTYAFAKSMTEGYIAERHGNVPVAIVRPSIVSASKTEPSPGWLDNWNGASGLIASVGKGIIRAITGSKHNVIDLIPVDSVANLLIVVGATCGGSTDVKIYNSCSSSENPLTLKKLASLATKDAVNNNFNKLPVPFVVFSNSKYVIKFTRTVFQTIPVYLCDFCLFMACKKQRWRNMLLKACFVADILEYFTNKSWKFSTTHTTSLANSLQPDDRELFPFMASDINWTEYIPIYCRGIRKHLMN